MASEGQDIWQRAPQAMHLPAMSRAFPRGFFFFLAVSSIDPPKLKGGLVQVFA
jgi:hypothetical protein